MSKRANQKIKILYLMKILYERTDDTHGLTLAELTGALSEYGVEVERKTLYDDLEVLRVFGMDIEARKDKTVRYHVVSRDFELPELKLLVDAVQASKFITHRKSEELIRKIESFTSRYERQRLERQVYVANRIKTMNESIYYIIDDIHEAIGKNVQISFEYFEWNEKKEKVLRHNGQRYTISPWALTWDDENYYLIAFDSGEQKVKHYRVDKMQRPCLTDLPRDGSEAFADFDMALYTKKTFGMYGGAEEMVTLRFLNRLAGVVLDRFGTDTVFLKDGPEHFKICVKVALSPLFFAWLLNFGTDVTILSPDSVKDRYKNILQETLNQYQ